VLWRRSLDAVVLLPPGSSELLTLAETGPAVWDLLADWKTVEQLVDVMAERYGAEPGRVAADVEPLLDRLVALGAVETAADSGTSKQEYDGAPSTG
jgi:hypothetical protein